MASARGGDVLLDQRKRQPGSDERATTTPSSRSATATCSSTGRITWCVRRDDSIEAGDRLVHPSVLAIPLADRRTAARRSRRSSSPDSVSRSISVRGCVRRRADPRRARCASARQRDQRCVVRPFDRRRAAQPDRGDACARARPADAARDEHRHHVGDRSRRPRARSAAVVHDRHPRDRRRRPRRRDALPAVRRHADTSARRHGARGAAARRAVAATYDDCFSVSLHIVVHASPLRASLHASYASVPIGVQRAR